jgi:hypothetical protein
MMKIMNITFDIYNVLAGLFLGFIICFIITDRCIRIKEGFSAIDLNMRHSNGDNKSSLLGLTNMKNGLGGSGAGVNNHTAADPVKQLEQGNMFMFNGTKFSKNCCPSPYGSSTGCACMSKSQNNFLNQRGGNRTQVSVY